MTGAIDTTLETPFLGLRYFDEGHSHLFFGRDAQINDILEKLRRSRLVTVMGSSGGGKSSLVRAGVIPRLKAGLLREAGARWCIAKMRPGSSPIASLVRELEKALSVQGLEVTLSRGPLGLVQAIEECRLPVGTNVLLVADQFEELFRYQRESPQPDQAKEEAAAFVKVLLEATTQRALPIYVIVTMRSDYLGNCAQFRDLPERINEGLYLVPRMRRDQLEQAIAGPAAVEDATIAPRLLQRLLNETGDDPDELPVLQHALLRTWTAWNHAARPLDLEDLDAVGGMRDGLSRHADEIVGRLSSDQQRVARIVFQQLSERDAEGREIRRPAPVTALAAVAGVTVQVIEDVVGGFVAPEAALLYRNEDGHIDITHESLIRKWSRIQGTKQDGPGAKGWMQEEVDARDQFLLLIERTAKNDTLMGRALEDAIRWRELGLNADWARRYTKTSGAKTTYQDVLRFIEECRTKDAARRRHRRWGIIGAATSVAVALIVIFIFGRTAADASRAKSVAEGVVILSNLERGDIVKLGTLAVQSTDPWHQNPALSSPEFFESVVDPKPLAKSLVSFDTAGGYALLTVINRGHRLFVQSRLLFGAMSFALEEVWLRTPDAELKKRALELAEIVRTAFVAYHSEKTDGFKVPPARATDDRLNTWRKLEPGEFMMGADDLTDDERPPHPVRLSASFSMQQYEVTNEEYQRFDPTLGFPPGNEKHPRANVSWYEAAAYAAWLGASLPTEAQWEYAARGTGGSKGRGYPWPEGPPDPTRAVYNSTYPQPVGSRPQGRTPEGLDDMAGSVWEWCRDLFGPYSPEPNDKLDPLGPSARVVEGTLRVVRGGGVGRSNDKEPLRAAGRAKGFAERGEKEVGFRLVSSRLRP